VAPVISLADIRAARERVGPVLRPTPLEVSDTLGRLAERPILLKPEYRQRTGSFKIRGAFNLISQLPAGVPVVAASAGNHAQGVALAARLTDRTATIFMPANAALPKVEATRAYGADVRLEGTVVDESLAQAEKYAASSGAVFVPPFDDPDVIAGQGTIGLELADEAPDDLEVVVVPVGGGGLISGIAAALAHTRSGVRVVGVEAAGAASVRASLDAGALVTLDEVSTMADGIALKRPCDLTMSHIRAYVDDVVTVTEEETSRALLLLLERAKAVVEPAGAVALAALLSGKVRGRGPAVAMLSGGNVDPLLLIKLIDHGLTAAGRYLMLRIVIPDRPGTLASLTTTVASMGLNVLSVEHHRVGVDLPVDKTEVLVTVETTDPDHRHHVVDSLRAAGFDVQLLR
jgi:threonine dehydratase